MPRTSPLLVPALLLAAGLAPAAEPVPAEVLHRPTAVPDRVLLTWKADPATTQSVTWRTDATVSEAVAEIAPAGPGPDFAKAAKETKATTTPLDTNLGKAHLHAATFEGLKPDALYAYRVGDGEKNWSEWFHFRTASDKPAPLEFIYVGDAQNDLKSLWSRVVRQAYADAPKARFLLHAGDLINRGDADAEWGEWFYGLGWVGGSVTSLAVPGNHEYSSVVKDRKGLTPYWRPRFEFPENGPTGLEETAYYVDVQGVRIVALNSNEDPEPQAEWLRETLKDNPNRWTIVTHHHPIHSSSRGRDNEHLRRAWQPVYDEFAVDLVLQGHDHSYGRSGLLTGRGTQPGGKVAGPDEGENVPSGVRGRSPGGTVYVVSVSGPKMYALKEYPEDENPFRRRAADTQLYQVLTVAGDELRYEARTATGDLYDAFTLKKRAGEPNEFAEQVPEGVKERLGKAAK